MRAATTVLALASLGLTLALPGPAAAADPAEIELAETYAPVVRLVEQAEECAEGEPYAPIDVELVLGNDEVAFRGPWDTTNLVAVGPTGEEIGQGRFDYHLDFPGEALDPGCTYELWQRRLAEGSAPTVYAHVAREADRPGKLALQYWFFYVFNDFNNLHEGDWETIQLVFDANTAEEALQGAPVEVGYSQHEGAERAEWGGDKLEIVGGTHPVVYPAAGSHASFYDEGLFLGRSAAQGVGCDDTNGPHRETVPTVATVPSERLEYLADFPWLGFQGRWGELRPAFFNGPTGPNMKIQWTEPISWAEQYWRSAAFAVPAGRAFGPAATDVFCGGVEAVSNLLIKIVRNPWGVIAFFGALAALLLWAASRTEWESSAPLRLGRRRAWGQLIVAARRMYTERFSTWVGIGLLFIPVLALETGLQAIIIHLTSIGNLVESTAETSSVVAFIVLGLGLAFTFVALTVVQAATALAMVAVDEGGKRGAREAYRKILRRELVGVVLTVCALVVVVVLLTTSVVGIPFAIWIVFRSSFLGQAFALEGLSGPRALARSFALVRGRWWRVATIEVLVTGLALLLGPLVGIGILFATPTSATLDVVNLVSSVIYTITMPFAAIASTYLYFDCRVREELEPVERRSSDTLPAEIT